MCKRIIHFYFYFTISKLETTKTSFVVDEEQFQLQPWVFSFELTQTINNNNEKGYSPIGLNSLMFKGFAIVKRFP